MTTLRVLLSAAPDPGRAEQWALFDAAGRRVRGGRTSPAQWPTADRVEAVLAARAVRIVSLALPPERAAGRIVGEGAAAVPALMQLLTTEAKAI